MLSKKAKPLLTAKRQVRQVRGVWYVNIVNILGVLACWPNPTQP